MRVTERRVLVQLCVPLCVCVCAEWIPGLSALRGDLRVPVRVRVVLCALPLSEGVE